MQKKLQRDSIEGEANSYGYVKDNLLKYVNPNGLLCFKVDLIPTRGTRVLCELVRAALRGTFSTVATAGFIFESFYDYGVIAKAAFDATSSENCE